MLLFVGHGAVKIVIILIRLQIHLNEENGVYSTLMISVLESANGCVLYEFFFWKFIVFSFISRSTIGFRKMLLLSLRRKLLCTGTHLAIMVVLLFSLFITVDQRVHIYRVIFSLTSSLLLGMVNVLNILGRNKLFVPLVSPNLNLEFS